MRIASVTLIVVGALIGGAVLFRSPIHDLVAICSTRYVPGFSQRVFQAIRIGDSRESVIAALGQPFTHHYLIYHRDGWYNYHPVVPLSELPRGTSLHEEILEFSEPRRKPHDYRSITVILDSSGRVAYTRDYVTD